MKSLIQCVRCLNYIHFKSWRKEMNSLSLIQNNSTAYFQSTTIKLFRKWIKQSAPILILQVCLFVLMSGALVLAQDSDRALYIDSKGHVGIGNNDPKAALDVSGTILGIGMVPPGGIIMYNGDIKTNFDEDGKGIENTPCEGWQLCNGNNDTPDLRDKFIAMAGRKYKVGDQGGSDSITLTVDQMPAHNHEGYVGDAQTLIPKVIKNVARKAGLVTATTPASGPDVVAPAPLHKHTIPTQGAGKAHENRPQFYALAFIMNLPEPPGKWED
jgi:hypothetical protein